MVKKVANRVPNETRSKKTVQKVLDVAEKQFSSLGYTSVGTDALLQDVGLTRGALYYHFGSKQGLFEAVVNRVQETIAAEVRRETDLVTDPWQRFVVGCFTWLDSITNVARQQILLIDAPAVLGWERWLEFDAKHGSQTLAEGLTELVEAGIVEISSTEAMLHLLNGAMNQAALWVAQSPQPEQALVEAKKALERLLSSLKRT